MNKQMLIDQIEAMRDGYLECMRIHSLDCPQSAAMEEIRATRTANRIIFELEAELKEENKKLKRAK